MRQKIVLFFTIFLLMVSWPAPAQASDWPSSIREVVEILGLVQYGGRLLNPQSEEEQRVPGINPTANLYHSSGQFLGFWQSGTPLVVPRNSIVEIFPGVVNEGENLREVRFYSDFPEALLEKVYGYDDYIREFGKSGIFYEVNTATLPPGVYTIYVQTTFRTVAKKELEIPIIGPALGPVNDHYWTTKEVPINLMVVPKSNWQGPAASLSPPSQYPSSPYQNMPQQSQFPIQTQNQLLPSDYFLDVLVSVNGKDWGRFENQKVELLEGDSVEIELKTNYPNFLVEVTVFDSSFQVLESVLYLDKTKLEIEFYSPISLRVSCFDVNGNTAKTNNLELINVKEATR